jgi:8-oxo-dGTP pyrophosphatase MutT (NUDIX family)
MSLLLNSIDEFESSGNFMLSRRMLNRDGLAALLRATNASAGQGFSDDGDWPNPKPRHELTPAAVLIPVINRTGVPTVMFTQRTAHLNDHAGQISFPGGRKDAGDVDAADTALRETEEETGLPRDRVEILGSIPDYSTGTGFIVTPVVGWIESPTEYKPDPFEVAEVFEVPLEFLLDPRNHRQETALFKGRMRTYYAMPWQDRYIWGATAGMLLTFYRVIAGAQGIQAEPPVRMSPDSG